MLTALTFPGGLVSDTSTYGTLQQLGLASGLQICLDASVSASYSGSGQTWTDLSGNSNNFFLGTGSGAGADDPTFTGTAGSQTKNTYWSFNGSQMFTYNTTNPAFINNLHKAGQTWTIVAWINFPSTGSTEGIFGTNAISTGANVGVSMNIRSTNVIRVVQSSGTNASNTDSTITLGSSGWHMIGVSMIITNGANCFMQIDGTSETVAAGITTPSAGAAAFTAQIAATGNSQFPLINTARMGNFSLWNTQLTSANMTAIYNAIKDKFA